MAENYPEIIEKMDFILKSEPVPGTPYPAGKPDNGGPIRRKTEIIE